jgi:hypothetical protein
MVSSARALTVGTSDVAATPSEEEEDVDADVDVDGDGAPSVLGANMLINSANSLAMVFVARTRTRWRYAVVSICGV